MPEAIENKTLKAVDFFIKHLNHMLEESSFFRTELADIILESITGKKKNYTEQMERKYQVLRTFLKASEEELCIAKTIYSDFFLVSTILMNFIKIPNHILSKEEKDLLFSNEFCKDILFYIIEKNIKNGIITSPYDKIDFYYFISCCDNKTFKQLERFVFSGDYIRALDKKENERSAIEKNYLTCIQFVQKHNKAEIQRLSLLHQSIKEHYFDKQNTFDFEDIAIILKTLSQMEIDTEIVKCIDKSLRKELRARNSQQNVIDITNVTEKKEPKEATEKSLQRVKEEKEQMKKRKEEKEIFKTLNSIYNMEEKRLCVLPTEEMVFLWLREARRVHIPEKTIYEFLRTVDREINQMDPFVRYRMLYKKLKYYEKVKDISFGLQPLEIIVDEYIALQEEYESLEKEKERSIEEIAIDKDILRGMQEENVQKLEEHLNFIMKLVPKDYAYEFSKESKVV